MEVQLVYMGLLVDKGGRSATLAWLADAVGNVEVPHMYSGLLVDMPQMDKGGRLAALAWLAVGMPLVLVPEVAQEGKLLLVGKLQVTNQRERSAGRVFFHLHAI